MTGPSGGELFVSTLEETNRVISEFQKASKFIDKGFGAKGQCYCINLNFQFNGKLKQFYLSVFM